MAPSGTVEVCRGPAAPRDASGAEVCVPCVCRSLSNNDTKAQNPKKTTACVYLKQTVRVYLR